MKIKTLWKYLCIAVLTAVMFLFGLYWATRLVTPAGNIESFYDEPKDSIDVLVVGGSHIMCSISSVGVYDETGLTTYNLSTWSQPVWVSYYYIKEALEYQSPQVVILDVFGSFYDRSYLTGVDVDLVSDDFAQLMKPSLNLLGLNYARWSTQVTRKPWSEYLNIAKYHSRITELTAEDFGKIFQDDSTTAKGYGPFYTMEDFSDYTYPETDRVEQLYPQSEEYLIQLITMLQKRGIRPVLVKVPHIADETDIALVNRIQEIADEYQVDFLDFCSSNVLGLDFATDFADHGHVNNYGAKKVTAAVSEYLSGLELTAVHSDATARRWQEASAVENDEEQKMEIRISRSLQDFAQRVAAHESSSLIVSVMDAGGLTEEDYARLESLLADSSLAELAPLVRDERAFVCADGRLLTGQAAVDWCAERGITLAADGTGQISSADGSLSYAREGLNAAVYDEKAQQCYFYCSFAKEHDYEPYTQ